MCLRDSTCDCEPFYEGKACGTFKGCPKDFDQEHCNELLTKSMIQTNDLPNLPIIGMICFIHVEIVSN
jgi:hypothetical protein